MEGFESYQGNFRIDMEADREPAELLVDGADGGSGEDESGTMRGCSSEKKLLIVCVCVCISSFKLYI